VRIFSLGTDAFMVLKHCIKSADSIGILKLPTHFLKLLPEVLIEFFVALRWFYNIHKHAKHQIVYNKTIRVCKYPTLD
jgi:hypothetical protein